MAMSIIFHSLEKKVAESSARAYVSTMTNAQALERLVQTAGSQKRLAEILDTSEERVSRWVNGHHQPPSWLAVIAEFVEQTPPRDWPERWRR